MTEKIEYKGYTIKVELDEDNESPREWDNACLLYTSPSPRDRS